MNDQKTALKLLVLLMSINDDAEQLVVRQLAELINELLQVTIDALGVQRHLHSLRKPIQRLLQIRILLQSAELVLPLLDSTVLIHDISANVAHGHR